MGEIAEKFCSEIVLTNEDPYDESPEQILRDIRVGIKEKRALEILDREEVIREAVGLVRNGDVVVVTGKGSERVIHLKKEIKFLGVIWK